VLAKRIGHPQLRFKLPHQRSQEKRILEMLRQAREEGRAVNIVEFLDAHIATYCARIRDLRLRGYVISNHLSHTGDGVPRSTYTLDHDPEVDSRECRRVRSTRNHRARGSVNSMSRIAGQRGRKTHQ
jgi:Helix-turn-helix domain